MRSAVLLAAFCAFVFASAELREYHGFKLFRVTPKTQLDLDFLHALEVMAPFDFWSKLPIEPKGTVDIMVAPPTLAYFTQHLDYHKMPYKILIEDVEKIISKDRQKALSDTLESREISFTRYNRYDEIQKYSRQLAANYSEIVSLETIGQSYEGREMAIVKISTGGNGSKPAIIIDGGLHAREWISPAFVLYIINQLVENPSNSPMIENVDWYILPVLNPDGYEYTHTSDRFWRKTMSIGKQCDGVDGNRNFGYHWMEAGASSYECSETYAGPEPFSEPETTALKNFILKYQDQLKLYLTFHSYGQYILYPWGYTSDLPEDVDELDSLGRKVNDAIRAVDGTRYTVGSSTNVLYAAAGGSDDWAKGVAGVQLSYTIELPGGGMGGFDLPPSEILDVCVETFEGVKVYLKHIEDKFGSKH